MCHTKESTVLMAEERIMPIVVAKFLQTCCDISPTSSETFINLTNALVIYMLSERDIRDIFWTKLREPVHRWKVVYTPKKWQHIASSALCRYLPLIGFHVHQTIHGLRLITPPSADIVTTWTHHYGVRLTSPMKDRRRLHLRPHTFYRRRLKKKNKETIDTYVQSSVHDVKEKY